MYVKIISILFLDFFHDYFIYIFLRKVSSLLAHNGEQKHSLFKIVFLKHQLIIIIVKKLQHVPYLHTQKFYFSLKCCLEQ